MVSGDTGEPQADEGTSPAQFCDPRFQLAPYAAPRRAIEMDYYHRLDGDGAIDLDGNGSDVNRRTLSVVLDAARSTGLHTVSLDAVNGVVSEMGSLIVQFLNATDRERQHAREALYTEIARRCTNI